MEGGVEEKKLKSDMSNLGQYELRELLADLKESKMLVYRAEREGQQALVVLQKRDWVATAVEKAAREQQVPLELDVHNAEYFQFVASFPRDCDVKITWPASEVHIGKWRQAATLVVREEPAHYAAATLPFVAAVPASHTAWVDNILRGEKEADRVWLQHADFAVVPDFKMNLEDPATAYVQVLARDPSLRSLRDVRGEHAALLSSMREAAAQQMKSRLGFPESELRFFLHYFPTFWRLHLHVAHVRFAVPGGGLTAGRAVLLEDVLQNVALCPDYYQRATLVSTLREGSPHHAAFAAAGIRL